MKKNATENKLRGGYYTPEAIARFLASWAITDPGSLVLEPSCGDGVFVREAVRRHGRVVGVELDKREAGKARVDLPSNSSVIEGDAFSWYENEKLEGRFDAAIGNPPFIRYQDFPEKHRTRAFRLMEAVGLRPSRLTNIWLPFVVLATRALRPGGRLGLVLPAELLQVGYAAQLRQYLVESFSSLTILTFRKLVFPGIQQEVVLLLGVRRSAGDPAPTSISLHQLDGLSELDSVPIGSTNAVAADLHHAREKWTQYYLHKAELDLIRRIESSGDFPSLGSLAEVDVGIVTGQNRFFVLSKKDAAERRLTRYCLPLVGRAAHLPGLTFNDVEWRTLVDAGQSGLLLQLGKFDRAELPSSALEYVREGEGAKYDQGYKCSIRKPRWWLVPTTWRPDGFLLRQIYDAPRIIANASKATCTDTIHRLRTKPNVDIRELAAMSMNSLTCVLSEIRGRSYGGGVLELEPTEAEGLLLPPLGRGGLDITELDKLCRTRSTVEVVERVDRAALTSVGLDRSDVRLLHAAWLRLMERRLRRKGEVPRKTKPAREDGRQLLLLSTHRNEGRRGSCTPRT